MRYFLPELYVQLNSADEDLADAAEEALDQAGAAYNRHWEKIKTKLPVEVVEFAETLSLHDADVFAPAQLAQQLGSWQPGDILIVGQQINTLYPEYKNTLALLHYSGECRVVVDKPVCSSEFNPVQPVWLYDEFDVVNAKLFSHQILLSDGRVISMEFRQFQWHIVPLVLSANAPIPHV